MIHRLNKFQMVVIDYPINVLDDAFSAELLGKALKMKYEGYANTYDEKVLPMDKTDFFGTHMIFCEEVGKTLEPIFAYKATPLKRCLKHEHEFPALSLMKSDGDPSCLKVLSELIAKVGDPDLISYDSSWAQSLKYRFGGDVELKQLLREIMFMVIVMHHEEFNLPHMITCGAVKVKTDRFFLDLGLKKLNDKAHFFQKGLNNEESVIFYNDTFSPDALAFAKKHQGLWRNKILVNGEEKRIKKAA